MVPDSEKRIGAGVSVGFEVAAWLTIWRLNEQVENWTRHPMSIAVGIIAALARSLLRIDDARDAAQNQDSDY